MQAAANQSSLRASISPANFQEQDRTAPYRSGPTHEHQYALCPAIVGAALEAFVDRFEQGVAVVDRFSRALFLNQEARAIIRGTHLRLADGRLRASAPSGSIALRKLIADCAASGYGSSLRLGSDEDTLLIAASAFLSGTDADADPVVLLRLINPVTARPPAKEALQAQFGLTPTEAAFALEMLAGNDLAASAARRGVTLNTARAHLRRIFDKTQTHRQAALMRLLLLCPRPIVD